ncbi:DUF308 domain-containing protein [Microbacterium sp.]|uniref:DUF308 domain-containing protein n=1 Tax=Microbacterium sp. TaxID=51671 RepID=UPI002D768518|nr:DUF308 domain-containing protein [Microbacterium sp.]HET6302975.1 DUF308 domain-containing protein [Microbacterium sp.]
MTDEPSDDAPSARDGRERSERVREVLAVVVLSVTAILTAWCGFEASKWGGMMSIEFSQASAARIAAADAASTARDNQAVDLSIYELWVQARATGDTAFAEYVEARFTPEFAVAFEDWQAGGESPRSPFAEPSYVPEGRAEAEEASDRADALFAKALESNQRGDDYALLTVLFALVLFFVAVSERTRMHWSGWFLLGLGIVVAAAGVVILVTFPILV